MSMTRRRSDRWEDAGAVSENVQLAKLQFVTFTVAEQRYGLDILMVREIRIWSGATSLPNAAAQVRGVINLRGSIIPVIDMRVMFGMPPAVTSETSVVVIVAANSGLTGLLVDGVNDIIAVDASDISAMPPTAGGEKESCFKGLISAGEGLVAVLDLDSVTARQSTSVAGPLTNFPETSHAA